MATSKRPASLRVVNSNVDLGGGFCLPAGDYEGSITDMTVMVGGQELTQIAKVQLYLSEEKLQAIGFPPKPDSTSLGIEGDFTPSFLNGDIREV